MALGPGDFLLSFQVEEANGSSEVEDREPVAAARETGRLTKFDPPGEHLFPRRCLDMPCLAMPGPTSPAATMSI